MQSFVRTLLMTMVITLMSLISFAQTNNSTATVTSDKPDYAPRSNAVFTGAGFQPGETVVLKVKNLNYPCHTVLPDSSYTPWSVIADSVGGFVTNWTVCDCAGDSLKLKAVGQTSGTIATVLFSDSGPAVVSDVALAFQSGSAIYGNTSSYTFSVTVTRSSSTNNETATLAISSSTPLPAGVTATFSPTGFTGTNDFGSGGNSVTKRTATLTLNISGTALPVTNFSFKVTSNTVNSNAATFTISKRDLTPSFTASNKTYDGTTSASITNRSLSGIVNSDDVSLGTSGTASFPDANVANGKTVTATGFSLTGTKASNYTLASTSATATANIIKADATINITSYNISYDGTAHTAIGTATGVESIPVDLSSLLILNNTTHTNAGDYTNDTWTFAGNTNYNSANGTIHNKITQASSTTTVSAGNTTYDGLAHGGTAIVTGAGGLSQSVSVTYTGVSPTVYASSSTAPTNAGTYTATATFAGDANHAGSTDAKNFTISQADANITITPYTVGYDGNSHTATGSATGVETTPANLGGLLSLTSTTHTAAGDYPSDAWSFAGNTNYKAASGTVYNIINKAASVTTVTAPNAAYDNNTHGGTATVTGVGGLSQSVTITYTGINGTTYGPSTTAPINAGSYNAAATFSGDINHNPSSDNKDFTIAKATPVITLTVGGSVTYDGTPHYVTSATVTGVNNTSLGNASVTYTKGGSSVANPTDAGDYSVTASFIGDNNYNDAEQKTGTLTINKAPSVTKVTIVGGPFTYTGSPITPASVSVTGAGGLNLTPLADYTNNTAAGLATAGYSFTGDDNHIGSSDSKNFTIDKATPVITWNSPSSIKYGVALSGTQLNASTTVGGSFSYTPAAGSYLHAGNGQSLSVTFTPADAANYNTVNQTTTIDITKADATINVNGYNNTFDGNPHGATGTATGARGENLNSLLHLGNNYTHVPGGSADWTFDGDADHNSDQGSVTIQITKASSSITVTGANTFTYDGTAQGPATSSQSGSGGAIAFSYSGTTNGNGTYGPVATAPTAAGSYSVTATLAGDNDHDGAVSEAFAFTIGKATTTTSITITGSPFTYTGSAITPATVSVTGPGGFSLTPTATYTNNINAGQASASYSYAGDDNYKSSDDTKPFTIGKATPAITVTPYSVTYDANDHTATGTAKGVLGETLTGLDLSGSTHNSAGTTTDTWTFTDATGNYNNATGTVSDKINKASSSITITVTDATYDASAHGGTAAVSGAGGLNQSIAVTYDGISPTVYSSATAPVNAGSYTISASYEGDENHEGASDSKSFTIGKANASVTVDPYTVTYDAAAHTSTGSATGVGGIGLSGLDLNGTTHTVAGDYNDSWTFTDVTGNYKDASGTVANKINKASSVTAITVTDATYDGSAHGGTATVTGVGGLSQPVTISYSGTNGTTYGPSAIAPTNAGYYSAVATFAGDDNHNTSTDTKAFKIDKATPVITWTNPSGITYGTALSAAQLNATANVSGTFVYTPDAGSYLTAGNNKSLSVTFTPADLGNYNEQTATAHINVAKAEATISIADYTNKYDGLSHSATLTSATGARNEDLSNLVSFTNNSYTNVPGGTANWSFAGDANHNPSNGTASVTIGKAIPVITLNIGGPYTYTGTAHGVTTAIVSGVSVNGTPEALGSASVTYDGSSSAPVNAGDYPVIASFAGNSNYVAAANQTGILTINKADAHITVTPYDVTYDGDQHIATATATGVESTPVNLSSLFMLTGTAHTNANSYTDSWSFAGNNNYNAKSGTITDNIAKANATITVTPYDVTYDGNAHTSTGSAKGVKGETLSGLDLSGTTHTNAGTTDDQWAFTDVTGNYNNASNQVNNKIGKADATISVSGYSGTYDGNAHGASGTATGVGGADLNSSLSLGSSFTNYPGGTAHWTFTGGTNYNDKSGNVAIDINKANAKIIVTPYDVTFDNNAHTATATAVGVESTPVNLAGLLNLSGTTHTGAGDYTADAWTFAGNINYNTDNGTVHNKIAKASSVTTVTVSDVTYDGASHGGTATVTGVGGLNQPVSISYSGKNGTVYGPSNTAPTNAGSYNATATFAGDANHSSSTDTKSFTIGKADQVITVTTPAPASTVYKSGFTVSANASSGLAVSYSSDLPLSNTGAAYSMTSGTGTGKVRINQAGNENYNAASEVVVEVSAEKAAQTISWTTPAAIDYPAALGSTQLNASVSGLNGGSAAGALTFTPALGTILTAGQHTLSVTAAATADYAEATKTVQITVNKGTPVITWNNPSGITYGQLLDNTQLNATASVPGTLTYSPASGTLLNAGNNQQLSVSFTPADADNYNTTGKTVSINVAKATPTITVTVGGPYTYNGSTQGIQSATVAGVLVNGTPEVLGNAVIAYKQNSLAATPLNAGTYQVCASFAGNSNYNSASDNTKSMTIDKADQTITWNNPANIVYSTPLSTTQLNANVTGVAGGTSIGVVTYTPAAGTILHAGNGQSLTVNVAATNNYNPASQTVSIDVDKFTPVITLVPGGPYTYDNTIHPAQTVSLSKVGSDQISADVVYKDADNVTVSPAPINAGNYTVQASFAGNSDYNSASKSCSLVINKANQLITWNDPSAIVYGTALGSSQLNAMVAGVSGGSATGSVTYTPAAGTVLHAGAGQALKVDVAATANYNAATQTVFISVGKYTPTVSINPGGPYQYDGATHSVIGSSVSGVNGDVLTATVTYTDGNNISVTPAPKEAGSYTALASFAGNSDYNGASKSCTLTITKAPSSVSMSDVTATYDGQPHGASATATAVNVSNPAVTYLYTGIAYNSSNAPVNAGTYSVTATYAGDANHTGSSSTKTVTIDKATTTTIVTINGSTFTYTGSAITPATVSVTGAGGLSLTPDANYINNINAGTATASYNYNGDANHSGSSDSKNFSIGKANASIVVTPYHVTYDGAPHTATVVAKGVESTPANLNSLVALTGTTHTNADDYPSDAWSFPGNGNYNASGGTVHNIIDKAPTTTVVTIVGGPFTYTGAAITPATVSVTGAGSLSLTPTAAYSNNVNAGTATASYTYDGDANHLGSNDSKPFTIEKATPMITWNNPLGITYGAALTATQLNATASVGGSFVYTPAVGVYLNAGAAQQLSVDFTPADNANYNSVNKKVTIDVAKANATLTVNGYTGIYDANAHGATGSAAGARNENLSGLLHMGSSFTNVPGGTANWTFDGDANHNSGSGSASITINKAPLTATSSVTSKVYDGTTATGSVSLGTVSGYVGTQTLVITPSSTGFVDANVGTGKATTINYSLANGNNGGLAINYSMAPFSTTGEITKRNLNVTATGISKVFDGTTTATVNLLSDKLSADDVKLSATASFIDANVGTGKQVNVTNIAISGGAQAGNYNLVNTTTATNANITIASTTTTLITSAGKLRFMDNITLTANVKPTTGFGVTGSVQFKINGVNFGSAVPVVPIPGDAENKVQATLIRQVDKMPGTGYTITAEFTSTTNNYGSSNSDVKPLQVDQRDASPYTTSKGFYTGDVFVWTTSSSSSKGSVVLAATVKDFEVPNGDVRAAKVTFYTVANGVLTPIQGAQNLPVGLVDVSDGSLGTTSAIVQFDIGSQNAGTFTIAVGITGAYKNDPTAACSQKQITVATPLPGGYIVGGGDITNETSSGYIKGGIDQTTDYEFDIQYTKSGSNPKGKSSIWIRSYNKPDGTLDTKLHTYWIQSTAISTLAVTQDPTYGAFGDFSSKANLYEQMPNLSLVQLEGGAAFQMQALQKCNDQQIAITLYRKAGGVWFSSNWVMTKTERKAIADGQVYVYGGDVYCKNAITVNTKQTQTVAPAMNMSNEHLAELSIKAYPNPSASRFNIKLEGDNSQGPISIKVFDLTGRVMETRTNLTANQTITIGSDYRPGVYIIEMIQGTQRKQLKLIKQAD